MNTECISLNVGKKLYLLRIKKIYLTQHKNVNEIMKDLKCGERCEDMIFHRSYTHISCEIKACKNARLNEFGTHDFS